MLARKTKLEEVSDRNKQMWLDIEQHRQMMTKLELERRAQANIERALSLVPNRFQNKTFADFIIECTPQSIVKSILESYVKTFNLRAAEGASLIFVGLPGTGKTLLSFIIYQHLVRQGFQVEYQPSLNFLRALREKQFESYQNFESSLNRYKTLDFLIIDEVTEGSGKGACPADWERHLLRMVIDVRYQENLPTLIISNRSKKDLIERLGEPAIDRLSEKGITLAFTWPSYRQK